MNRLPKLIESWEDGNTTVEIWENIGPLPNNSDCDVIHYSLRTIHKDSRKFPVLTGAIREAKGILKRKNNRELHKIGTEFDLRGKNEKDQ